MTVVILFIKGIAIAISKKVSRYSIARYLYHDIYNPGKKRAEFFASQSFKFSPVSGGRALSCDALIK